MEVKHFSFAPKHNQTGQTGAQALFSFRFQSWLISDIIITCSLTSNMMNKKTILFIGLMALPILAQGCVSRGAYNENMAVLLHTMTAERSENAAAQRSLEIKVQERGKTLSELTTRYIDLKAQQDYSQAKLAKLQSDLEGLLSSMSEMKLVIFTNFKGSEANEMMLKLNSMQKTVQDILKKSSVAMPEPQPLPPATPVEVPKGQQ